MTTDHKCFGTADNCLICGDLLPLATPPQSAAQQLLFTDYAAIDGAILELELCDDGFTLHVIRDGMDWQQTQITFESTDLDDLAALIAEGLSSLSVAA